MAERDFSVLEQYDCKVFSAVRGRGAFICETNRGPILLREFAGKPERLSARARLLDFLKERGIRVDYYLRNKEGAYVSKDSAEVQYTASSWFNAGECDIKNFSDVCLALKGLARLHKELEAYKIYRHAGNSDNCHGNERDNEFQIARNLSKEYDKHNKELKMIRNYLSDKHRKSDFELLASANCQAFLEEGLEAVRVLKASRYENEYNEAVREGRLCHGDFNYHNIFVAAGECCICGFEQCSVNVRLIDLYDFMRKLMEKYGWDIKMGYLMLREYDNVYPLEQSDVQILGAMFAYPEKFWKILNYYFNGNKAWIPARSMEKLKLAVSQNRMRREFVKTLV